MRILLVEDNADHRELMSLALTGHDPTWQVEEVVSGEEALRRLAEEEAYDLVFLDYSLLGRNGLEVLKEIRRGETPPPVVVVTGLGDEQVAVEAMKGGAYDYVVKGEGYLQRLPVVARRAVEAHQLAMEHKRAEEALRVSAQQWRTTFDAISDAVSLVDLEGGILRCNNAMTDLLGKPFSEIIGRTCWELVHGTSEPIEGCPMVRMWETRRRETLVLPMGDRWFEISVDPLPDEAGNLIGSVHVVADITERKQAEEALRDAEAKYRTLVEQLPAIIYIIEFGKVNRTIYISPQVESLLGFSQTEWLADPDLWIKQLHPNDRERVLSEVRRKDASGEPLDLEYRVLTGDGRVLWFRNQTALVRDETGRIRSSHGVMFDITKRKQLEAQLLQAQKIESIGQLAAGICHDFNNLLTPMGGFAELLLGKAPEGSKQHEYLRQIKMAAERAADLTGQLRLFTRQEKGERRPVQLNSVIEETRALLERSILKEITIELHLASELWAVEADSSQISQVLMNLCVNAHDAMPEGGILTLETRNVTLDEEYVRMVLAARPGRYVRLSISDTGSGMRPEVQDRLFEPFFTTKEVGQGTGLGLAMVYGIVKGHDGFIQVYSQEGRGSTFHVYLPAIEGPVEERGVEGWELPTGTETILLVDDEEGVQALGQAVLEPCGYTVLMAADGIQALEMYRAHRGEIGLVVLDVIMPQMGGQECLRRLRELDPQVKVLISTGYTARGLAQELVAGGALGVVEKPFRIQDFATAVRAALDKS